MENEEIHVKEKTAPHILNASSNLIGFCFIVLTSLKIMGLSKKTYIDEFTSVALVLFIGSCIMSYLSMRSVHKSKKYGRIADIIFLTGLLTLFIITVEITFNLV
ncbi:MAG: hypothetical protein ABI266_08435 [Ginsengibacter sp.]